MPTRFEPNFDGIREVMQSPGVRAALRKRADAISRRVGGLDAEFSQGVRVEDGTRPKGRPFSRVVHDAGADMEFGTSKTSRRRVLGRAADTRE